MRIQENLTVSVIIQVNELISLLTFKSKLLGSSPTEGNLSKAVH